MRTKLLCICIIFLFKGLTTFAQNSESTVSTYTVKGILLDSLTNEAEPYATIRIINRSNPEQVVKMAVTGLDGKFQEEVKAASGEYQISMSSIGKAPAVRDFELKTGTKVVDLGVVYIMESSELMEGVEIVAQKPLVKVDMDKIEYNIEDDPDAQSSTIMDMLRKVPLVTVDAQENIQVNGSSNFRIHVNNKPNTMMSNNPKEVLKSMPANTIKSIEVITEPGAKYDAEGVGGILNIITISGSGGMEGYTATFNGNANLYGAGGGAYATVQSGKFTVSGNYGYNHRMKQKYKNENYREDLTGDDTNKYLYTHSDSKSSSDFHHASIEGSYEIDTLRLVTFSANMYSGGNDSEGTSRSEMFDIYKQRTYFYSSITNNENSYQYVGASLDYQRSFKKKGELFTLSYRLSDNPNNSDVRVFYENDVDHPYPYSLEDFYSKNKAYTIEHTFQADYTNPINEKHEIETGAKYIIRNSRSDSHYYYYEEDNVSLVEQLDLRNKYDHLQDILAAYGGYRLKLKKFSAKAGVRYEHTFMKIKYHTDNERNFKSGFDDVVPSVNLSYQVANMKTLRFAYNMRISRPGIWYLNPYVNRTNPDVISYGNPDLKSEKSHTFGLNFNSFTQKINLDLGLRHTFANNTIEDYSFRGVDEETGRDDVLHSTYRNIGKYNNTRLSTYFNWNIASTTRFYVNGGAYYSDFRSQKDDVSNNGFGGNANGGFQHTLPWALRLSLNGGGGSRYISSQGENSGYYYYSIGLSKPFLKERLNISLHASNLFEKERSWKSTVRTKDFYSTSTGWYPSRYVGIWVSYRIGELKAAVKKAARSIENDDVKSGGGNSGGGSGSGQN